MNRIRIGMKLPNEDSIRESLNKQVENTISETKGFCQEVQLLNLTLLDERLDTRSGTLRAMVELGSFYELIGKEKGHNLYNKARDPKGDPKVYFEV